MAARGGGDRAGWSDPLFALGHAVGTFALLNLVLTWWERGFSHPWRVGAVLLVLVLASGWWYEHRGRTGRELARTPLALAVVAGATLAGAALGVAIGAGLAWLLGLGAAHLLG